MIFATLSLHVMEVMQPDELLLERLKQDDETALDHLFRIYYSPICSVLHYIIGDKEAAQELGADVFIKLWDKRHTIIISHSLKSYLFAMARNTGLAALRKNKTLHLSLGSYDDDNASIQSPGLNPEQMIISQQFATYVTAAVDEIEEKSRVIFSLSRDHGLKYREIASLLGVPEKTVEHHMGKALKFLKEKLKVMGQ